ncbi:MAG TPA: alpha/beta hydrolase [Polyangiales bacterium]|nr:alpha/beta hydrolase [Polyangiales bacterium]
MALLIVPGLGGSGPEHWQTRWEALDLRCTRLEQADWDQPRRGEWVDVLERAVLAAPSEVVLIAHSLGCITVAHWAARGSVQRVRGALLVAPADVEQGIALDAVPRCFAPVPLAPLPFRSIVVASADDPYASLERARAFAHAWGAEFEDVGAQGHINADSHLGDWEQGRAILQRLL